MLMVLFRRDHQTARSTIIYLSSARFTRYDLPMNFSIDFSLKMLKEVRFLRKDIISLTIL